MSDGLKVAICVPADDMCVSSFALDLAKLYGFTHRFIQEGVISDLGLLMSRGTYVHTGRQALAEEALAAGADYTFWLDSDMRFPKDALVRLLMHEKPFVACNYPKRGVPPEFVAIKRVTTKDDPGEVFKTLPDSEGLEEAEAVGFGCALIRRDVFERMDKPWFFFRWDQETGKHVGEDVFFCQRARESGTAILVDHDLSKEITHTGSFDYSIGHAAAFYEED